ncbi:hypothetical protein ANN_14532 [Periplaneta americana]|uniref:Uncharacterized protein n=1 Tax=Periplaneta americana TaxID=6978 RepID=A0ABQ8SYP7_PERAM|nr:hypothetical protein ANN_14532 [Periplaneta americana]
MKVLRRITGKTLFDRERGQVIRETCNIQQIGQWVIRRRQDWNYHINRMEDGKLIKIARDNSACGTRNLGRPKRRWKDSGLNRILS